MTHGYLLAITLQINEMYQLAKQLTYLSVFVVK